ncbi:hypothetical protein FOCC_FOCC014642 [Frankliniella occidentalis]|nr:hypothetical protein FOCC_FOCC014642 [Frankliniella occidentalis]
MHPTPLVGRSSECSVPCDTEGSHVEADTGEPTVMSLLRNQDVISVGQTCRSWRSAARHENVWRTRTVEYQLTEGDRRLHPLYLVNGAWGKHANAQEFSRTVRFAPCLAMIRCNNGMSPAARKAVFRESQCKPRGLEVNGGLVSALKYINRWSHCLENVTLLNPSMECLKTVVSLPNLTSLTIRHGADWNNQYVVPDFPFRECAPSTTLKHLTFLRRVPENAVNALVQAHASILEDLTVYATACLPQALSECTALQRLTVDMDPTGVDGRRLRVLLQNRRERQSGPLTQMTMCSLDVHDKNTCALFVASLRTDGFVGAAAPVCCQSCARGEPIVLDPHRMRRARLWDY